MNMFVNHPGHKKKPAGINCFCLTGYSFRQRRSRVCYMLTFNDDISPVDDAFVYYTRVFYYFYHEFFLYLENQLIIFILRTPQRASLKMPPDIFDVPSLRSVNIIGISTIL